MKKVLIFLLLTVSAFGDERDDKVNSDKSAFEDNKLWIYNDLDAGFKRAKETGKPMLVVYRCVPCHACAGIDGQFALAEDKQLRDSLDQFVPVRMVQGNGMDLSLFQFDYDMSFAVVFIDSDRNVLGRYGTRAKIPVAAESEISIKGLLASMQAVLDIKKHPNFPRGVVGKTGQKPAIATPEEHPLLAPKYDSKITYGNNVAQSCIHCHQIRDVERKQIRAAGQPIPDHSLFPYPMPSLLGLQFDKDTRATISEVAKGSVADEVGILAGDELFVVQDQFIVSVADIQWILQNAPDEGTLKAILKSKDGTPKSLQLPLRKDWRKKSDISWRSSTWDLRRQSFGGMKLDPLPTEERKRHGIADGNLALLAAHVGQYDEHAIAKNAGIKKGDILIEFDGITNDCTETDLITHAMQNKKSGDEIEMKLLQNGKEKTVKIRLP